LPRAKQQVCPVAVLSDIHGVAPALEAVLAEPDVRSVERIVVTGDISAGPWPVAVLDRSLAFGQRVVVVRGTPIANSGNQTEETRSA